jgi:hypothetical protein
MPAPAEMAADIRHIGGSHRIVECGIGERLVVVDHTQARLLLLASMIKDPL